MSVKFNSVQANHVRGGDSRPEDIVVQNTPPVWVTPAGRVATTREGSFVSVTLNAVDDTGIGSFVVVAGTLPPGLDLNPISGVISGTAANIPNDRTFFFAVRVTDAKGMSAQRGFNILVAAENDGPIWITESDLGIFDERSEAVIPLEVFDDEGEIDVLQVIGGQLPAGATLFPLESEIRASFAAVQALTSSTFTIRAIDGFGVPADRTFTIGVRDVNLPPQIITPSGGDNILLSAGQATTVNLRLLASDDQPVSQLVWTQGGGTLPPGVTLTSNGVVQGTTPATIALDAFYTFAATATDVGGLSDTATFVVEYVRPNVAPTWVSAHNLGTYIENTSFAIPLDVTDDVGTPRISNIFTTLIPSLDDQFKSRVRISDGTLDGIVSDVPPAGGSFSFIARATDSRGLIADRTFTVSLTNVNRPPVWLLDAGPIGRAESGARATFSIAAVDDAPGLVHTVVAGSLPSGLSLSASGQINGVPDAVLATTDFSFTVRATDAENLFIERDYSIQVVPSRDDGTGGEGSSARPAPIWVTSSLGTFNEDSGIWATLTANDPLDGAVRYTVGTAAPFGISIVGANILVGRAGRIVPEVAGEFRTFSVELTASSGASTTTFLPLVIAGVANVAPVWAMNSLLPPVAEGERFNLGLFAQDDEPGLTYSLVEGALPPFATFASSGLLSGVAPGTDRNRTWTFTVRATDAVGASADQTFTFTLSNSSDGPVWFIPSGTLATISGLSAFGGAFTRIAAQGARDDSYTIVSGALPSFITIDPETRALLVAAPDVTSPTTVSFTIRATSMLNEASEATYAFNIVPRVNAAPTIQTPPQFLKRLFFGEDYSFTYQATDDVPGSLTWGVFQGSLPSGISLSANGVLNGVAPSLTAELTNFAFSVTATDRENATSAPVPFSLEVARPPTADFAPVWVTPGGALGTFDPGVSILATLVATDDFAPVVSYAFISGTSMFPNFSVSPTGVLRATAPTVAAGQTQTARFVVAASDGIRSTEQSFSLVTASPAENAGSTPNLAPLWSTSGSLGSFMELSSIAVTLVATDDSTFPLDYMIASGILPGDLDLSPSGVLSGVLPPVSVDTPFTFTARVSDVGGSFTDRNFVLMVEDGNQPPVWISPPEGSLGTETALSTFSRTLLAADDAGAVTFALRNGSLPPGIVLEGAVLQGTFLQVPVATNGGTLERSFVVGARDASGEEVLRTFALTVIRANEPPIWSTTAGTLAVADEGASLSLGVMADDDYGVTGYQLVAGSLPASLVFSGTGSITGVLTQVSADSFSTFTLRALDAGGLSADRQFVIVTRDTPSWVTPSFLNAWNQNTSIAIQLVAANTEQYEVIGGALPPGLTLSPAGLLSGITPPSSNTVTTYSWTARATSALGATAMRSFSIQIADNPPYWVTPEGTNLGTYQGGQTFSQQLLAEDSNGDIVSYAVTVGSLPSGLSLNQFSGRISGSFAMPSATATSALRVRVTDAAGAAAEVGLLITVQRLETVVTWQTPSGTVVDDGTGAEPHAPLTATVTQQVV